jgi:hypothetical protein
MTNFGGDFREVSERRALRAHHHWSLEFGHLSFDPESLRGPFVKHAG